jgi:exodeoxyribonuclease VII large subunit
MSEPEGREPDRPWQRWLDRPARERSSQDAQPLLPGWDEPPHPADQFSLSLPSAAGRGPAAAAQRPGAAGPHIHAVGELTRLIRDTFRAEPRLRDVWVEGEMGQVTVSAAGHCYFTLKDERAQLRCVIFRDDRRTMTLQPQTGLRTVVHGRIDVFEPQGHYQLYVDTLQPAGFGDLALRFEALKARLAAEGLFEAARKQPLPAWPRTVGLATSRSGAVLHDVLQVLARRWPLVRVVLAPCQVQGDPAPQSIVAALGRLARWRDATTGAGIDVLILARGGGSLEDLWPFNDERVVRAVAGHPIPIVVGVGHETDVTLAEFAADVRAATPSVAAELAVPARSDQEARLRILETRLSTAARRRIATDRAALDAEHRALERLRPAALLAAERERIGLLLDRGARALAARLELERGRVARAGERLPALGRGHLARARVELNANGAALAALSPFATLERGYAIVRDADGRIVRDAAERTVGDALDIHLAHGGLDVRVERVRDSQP